MVRGPGPASGMAAFPRRNGPAIATGAEAATPWGALDFSRASRSTAKGKKMEAKGECAAEHSHGVSPHFIIYYPCCASRRPSLLIKSLAAAAKRGEEKIKQLEERRIRKKKYHMSYIKNLS